MEVSCKKIKNMIKNFNFAINKGFTQNVEDLGLIIFLTQLYDVIILLFELMNKLK